MNKGNYQKLDNDLKQLNAKIHLSKKEKEESFSKINKMIDEPVKTSRHSRINWKMSMVTIAALMIIALLSVPTLINPDRYLTDPPNASSQDSTIKTDEGMELIVEHQGNFTIHHIRLVVFKDGKQVTSPTMMNADMSNLAKDSNMIFHFLEKDFPFDGEMKVEVVIFQSEQDNVGITLKPSMIIEATKGAEYHFAITGSTIKQARLMKVE